MKSINFFKQKTQEEIMFCVKWFISLVYFFNVQQIGKNTYAFFGGTIMSVFTVKYLLPTNVVLLQSVENQNRIQCIFTKFVFVQVLDGT